MFPEAIFYPVKEFFFFSILLALSLIIHMSISLNFFRALDSQCTDIAGNSGLTAELEFPSVEGTKSNFLQTSPN